MLTNFTPAFREKCFELIPEHLHRFVSHIFQHMVQFVAKLTVWKYMWCVYVVVCVCVNFVCPKGLGGNTVFFWKSCFLRLQFYWYEYTTAIFSRISFLFHRKQPFGLSWWVCGVEAMNKWVRFLSEAKCFCYFCRNFDEKRIDFINGTLVQWFDRSFCNFWLISFIHIDCTHNTMGSIPIEVLIYFLFQLKWSNMKSSGIIMSCLHLFAINVPKKI